MTAAQHDVERPVAWTATVSAELRRSTSSDTYELVRFEGGLVVRYSGVVGARDPFGAVVLDHDQRSALLAELNQEIASHPQGVDPGPVREVADLLKGSLDADGSGTFASARFGVVEHGPDGSLLGRAAFGSIVAGTVRDDRGTLALETHVGIDPFSTFRPLDDHQLESLVNALDVYLRLRMSNQAWRPIRDDAAKELNLHASEPHRG